MKAAIFLIFRKKALECARNLCDILNDCDIEVYVDNTFINEFEDKAFVKYGLFDEFVREADFAMAIRWGRHYIKMCQTYSGDKYQASGDKYGKTWIYVCT